MKKKKKTNQTKSHHNGCPEYDTTQSDGKAPVMQEVWGMRLNILFPLLQRPLWAGVVAPDRVWQYPSRPPVLTNFFETILSWPVNHLVVSAGAFHISLWPQKYNRGNGRKRTKNKRTIWAWVNSKCKKGSFVTLYSLCICRQSLTCSFRETSTSY